MHQEWCEPTQQNLNNVQSATHFPFYPQQRQTQRVPIKDDLRNPNHRIGIFPLVHSESSDWNYWGHSCSHQIHVSYKVITLFSQKWSICFLIIVTEYIKRRKWSERVFILWSILLLYAQAIFTTERENNTHFTTPGIVCYHLVCDMWATHL